MGARAAEGREGRADGPQTGARGWCPILGRRPNAGSCFALQGAARTSSASADLENLTSRLAGLCHRSRASRQPPTRQPEQGSTRAPPPHPLPSRSVTPPNLVAGSRTPRPSIMHLVLPGSGLPSVCLRGSVVRNIDSGAGAASLETLEKTGDGRGRGAGGQKVSWPIADTGFGAGAPGAGTCTDRAGRPGQGRGELHRAASAPNEQAASVTPLRATTKPSAIWCTTVVSSDARGRTVNVSEAASRASIRRPVRACARLPRSRAIRPDWIAG